MIYLEKKLWVNFLDKILGKQKIREFFWSVSWETEFFFIWRLIKTHLEKKIEPIFISKIFKEFFSRLVMKKIQKKNYIS